MDSIHQSTRRGLARQSCGAVVLIPWCHADVIFRRFMIVIRMLRKCDEESGPVVHLLTSNKFKFIQLQVPAKVITNRFCSNKERNRKWKSTVVFVFISIRIEFCCSFPPLSSQFNKKLQQYDDECK